MTETATSVEPKVPIESRVPEELGSVGSLVGTRVGAAVEGGSVAMAGASVVGEAVAAGLAVGDLVGTAVGGSQVECAIM